MSVQIPIYGRPGLVGHTLIDDADADLVNEYRWNLHRSGYVVTASRSTVYLHRFVMKPEDGLVVDHINHDKLDNRRGNLRVVTRKVNQQNRVSVAGSSSSYRGVSFNKLCGRWTAYATYDGQVNYLGLYETEMEAARTAARFRAQHPHSVEDPALLEDVAA